MIEKKDVIDEFDEFGGFIDKAIKGGGLDINDFFNFGDFFGLIGKEKKGCGMAHTTKRLKKDQRRTPWSRLKPKEEAILDRAFQHVQSVPYRVSLRWLFYRLYQEGFYTDKKKDYKNKFASLLSRARHTFFKEWRPNTLEDETRNVIRKVGGYENAESAGEDMAENILDAAIISLDHFYRQENYVELWFEARAMAGQFEHFTRRIDLVPMGGSASIPFKWELAQRLNLVAEKYNKPIIILYFGDEDESGHIIQQTIEKDVGEWTRAGFELIWCGLTKDQALKHEIPSSIEGKGYQWEALPDKAAGEIITQSIEQYIDSDLIEEVNEEAQEFGESWRSRLEDILEELKK